MILEANLAVSPPSEAEHVNIIVIPQFSTVVYSARCASPLARSRGRPEGRSSPLRGVVGFGVAAGAGDLDDGLEAEDTAADKFEKARPRRSLPHLWECTAIQS
jgi:hypothetical protein